MSRFANSSAAKQPCFVVFSRFDDDDAETERQLLEDYEDEEMLDCEYEVLSDEFATESQIDYHNEQATTSSTQLPEKPTNALPARWTRAAIYYLIATYKSLARNETSGRTRIGPTAIWTEVSRRLQKRGFTCTPEQCRTKWTLLKKLYQSIGNEAQVRKFEFIDVMHEYYKSVRIESILVEMRSKEKVEVAPKRRGLKRKMATPKRLEEQEEIERPASKASAIIELFGEGFSGEDNDDLEFEDGKEFIELPKTGNVSETISEEQELNETTKQLDATAAAHESIVKREMLENHAAALDLNQEQTAAVTLAVTQEDLLRELREIVEKQEERREQRHKSKMSAFRVYNERLLAQQEAAVKVHREMMERLLSRL